ncbi:methionyl-tRNA formyltransferase, partial [Bacteroidota bacterium]
PEYIFFTHWSYIIPENIYNNYNCIVFHMTDLPYGRGGSPLQNLIERGHTHTKISALKVVKELDAGPIYLKRDLCLHGTAEEIFLRAGNIFIEMIEKIVRENPIPIIQQGEPVFFKRRKSEMSNMKELKNIMQVFDYIRMLDAVNYPNAFIENDYFKFEFSRAALKSDNSIIADVRIFKK